MPIRFSATHRYVCAIQNTTCYNGKWCNEAAEKADPAISIRKPSHKRNRKRKVPQRHISSQSKFWPVSSDPKDEHKLCSRHFSEPSYSCLCWCQFLISQWKLLNKCPPLCLRVVEGDAFVPSVNCDGHQVTNIQERTYIRWKAHPVQHPVSHHDHPDAFGQPPSRA